MATGEAGDERKAFHSDATTVTAWTLVSRITGFVRIASIGAVFGPTVLANIFQATIALPSIAYNVMAGSLIVSLLVPPLIAHLERGDEKRTVELANSLLGMILAAATVVGALLALASPLVARLLSLSATGAAQPAASRAATLLVLLVVPQVALYGIASVATAAQNAAGRFALAAAAPVAENVVVIATVALFARTGGGRVDAELVTTGQLVLLGGGATLAVAVHAGLQWIGATRAGIVLRPRFDVRDGEVLTILRRGRAALSTAVAQAGGYFVAVVAAGAVPGGVVAFQLALQTVQLPVALGARPVSVALLPRLARSHRRAEPARFLADYRQGLWLGSLIAAPATVGLIVFAPQIAATISVGRMSAPDAVDLVAVSLAGLALSIAGIALSEIARSALFAQDDVRTVGHAAWVQAACTVGGAVVATLAASSTLALGALGGAVALGHVVAGAVIHRRVVSTRSAGRVLTSAVGGTAGAALVAVVAAGALGWLLMAAFGVAATPALVAGITFAVAVYGGLLARWSPDFVAPTSGWLGRIDGSWRRLAPAGALVVGPLVLLVGANAAFLLLGWRALAAAVASAVVVAIARRPAVAAYLYVFTVPFLAGMERGLFIPYVRPNEALLGLIVAALAVRWVWLRLLGEPFAMLPTRLDWAVLVLVALGSIFPLALLAARGIRAEANDLLEPLVLWRLLVLYAVVRATVRTFDHLRTVLVLSLASASVVAVLAIVQGVGLLGPGEALLAAFWGPAEVLNEGRASTTLGSSLATGGYLAYSLAIAVAWWGSERDGATSSPRRAAPYLAVLFLAGGLGAGQFSSWIAVLLCGLIAAHHVGKLRPIVRRAIPAAPLAAVVVWPVLVGRLSEFGSSFGMPRSWIGRIDNLTTFYIPPLAEGGFVLGVRPNSILQAPEQWRQEIFLESGFLWLLWVGGIPFLAAFVWFVVEARRSSGRAVAAGGPTATVGAAMLASIVCLLVVTTIDKHLQLRGAGDLFFVLLALTLVGSSSTLATPASRPMVTR